ncbi:hypothetical protein EP331_14625 [bacterium]|nr:MAG: hypothetical protein EP331_14625 [bacterium]
MKAIFIVLFLSVISCTSDVQKKTINKEQLKTEADSMLSQWHNDAAAVNFDGYFGGMTETSYFIGTDATEYWTKKEFMEFSKPFFAKGKVWVFKAKRREIYLDDTGALAWFYEEINTSGMGECRGTGILKRIDGKWFVEQYNLALPVPNDLVKNFVKQIADYAKQQN